MINNQTGESQIILGPKLLSKQEVVLFWVLLSSWWSFLTFTSKEINPFKPAFACIIFSFFLFSFFIYSNFTSIFLSKSFSHKQYKKYLFSIFNVIYLTLYTFIPTYLLHSLYIQEDFVLSLSYNNINGYKTPVFTQKLTIL